MSAPIVEQDGLTPLHGDAQERVSPAPGTTAYPEPADSLPLRPANAVTATCCGAWWTGSSPCHCSGCHQNFSGISAFDRHRRGGKCADPDQVGLTPVNRKWEGWGFPGSWEPDQ